MGENEYNSAERNSYTGRSVNKWREKQRNREENKYISAKKERLEAGKIYTVVLAGEIWL